MKPVIRMSNKILSVVLCLGLISGCSLQLEGSNSTGTTKVETSKGDSTKPTDTKPTDTSATDTSASDTSTTKPGTTPPLTGSGAVTTQPVESFPAEATVAKRILGTIHTLNPHQIKLSSEEDMAKYLFGALYMGVGNPTTGKLEFLPYQAEAKPTSSDAKNFTIRLRPGLRWSDGTPISARDYVDSMKLLLDPMLKNPMADRFSADLGLLNAQAYQQGNLVDFSQVGFRAVDDLTLELQLERSMAQLDVNSILSTPFLVKASIYESLLNAQKSHTSYGTDYKQLIFAGPYEMENYVEAEYVRLKRQVGTPLDSLNQVYYTADYITQKLIPDKATALKQFLDGSLDVVPISGRAYREFKNDPRVRIEVSNTVWGMYVNTLEPGADILKNKDFRQALYYGVDRTAIAVTLFGSYSSYSGFVGPQSLVGGPQSLVKYRNTSRGKQSVPEANIFNLKVARKYAKAALEEVTTPQTIELTIPAGDAQLEEMAKFLKTSWEELFGADKITFTIKQLPLELAYDSYRARDYDLGFGGMGQELYSPWRSLAVFGSNYPDKLDTMADSRFDELQLKTTTGDLEIDLQGRLDALQEMEDILLEKLPQIPMFVNNNAYLVSDQITLPFKDPVPGYGLGLDMAKYK